MNKFSELKNRDWVWSHNEKIISTTLTAVRDQRTLLMNECKNIFRGGDTMNVVFRYDRAREIIIHKICGSLHKTNTTLTQPHLSREVVGYLYVSRHDKEPWAVVSGELEVFFSDFMSTYGFPCSNIWLYTHTMYVTTNKFSGTAVNK